jgi:hypothetical protein
MDALDLGKHLFRWLQHSSSAVFRGRTLIIEHFIAARRTVEKVHSPKSTASILPQRKT